ncbi:MAG: recombinase family protein, partial [Clostridia bacterium]|nr:recombinase family protein [Clostridia bacterium]
EGYAEYYSVELAEKINRGLTENALKGKLNGGSIPMGYRMTKEKSLEIDEETAPIVLEVFNRYNGGENMTTIAHDLSIRGIKSQTGGKISLNLIHYMLKNRRYLGEYRFRDIVHENAFPAIIPADLFDSVQKKMEINKKAPARHKADDDYILTTKLRCGRCGAFMIGESGTSKTGVVHHYYKCVNTKRRKTCGKKAVKKKWIEDIVVQYIMKIIMDDELIETISDRILDMLSHENTKIPQLQARLKEINAYIDNLLDAIQQGLFNASAKKRLDELEESKQEIETAIYSEQLQKPEITKEHIVFFMTKFRKANPNDLAIRKQLIESFVNCIYLYDDKIVFSFNYKDGTKELTFDEINEELSSDLERSTPPRRSKAFCQPSARSANGKTFQPAPPFPTNLLLRKSFAGALNIFGVLCVFHTHKFTITSKYAPYIVGRMSFAINVKHRFE